MMNMGGGDESAGPVNPVDSSCSSNPVMQNSLKQLEEGTFTGKVTSLITEDVL